MDINIGDKAPNFNMYNDANQQISLSDFEGKKVVLLFFPLAFTGVCTKELCYMRDNLNIYEGLNAEILATSIDSTAVLAKFKSELGLSFNLLSDFNKTTASDYGVLYETFPAFEMKGVAKRSVFVINEEGVVIHKEVCASPGEEPSYEAIEKALA